MLVGRSSSVAASRTAVIDESLLPSTSSRCYYPCITHRRSARDVRRHARTHDFSLWRGETPVPRGYQPGVLQGARTRATPLLSPQKVVDRLMNSLHGTAEAHYGAFYSSELGGITTEPALMVIHMDDHMVHRGHGVFDTALISDGHLYQLPEHFQRFKVSAEAAGIPFPKTEEAMLRIILDTAAASKRINGMVKYWVTAGRGGFGLSTKECLEPGFYALASSEVTTKIIDRTKGWTACISSLPCKPAPFATVKSNNYLQNAMVQMESELRGFDVGIFVDQNGHVQEGPNMNLAIITKDDVLITPPAEGCLAGITMQRLIELIPEERKRSSNDVVVSDVQRRQITVEDVLAAKECFMTGSSIRVVGITHVDELPIADGTPGMVTVALAAMIDNDMQPRPDSDQHIEVPYGYVTGMRSQLV